MSNPYEGFVAVYPPQPMKCSQSKIMLFEIWRDADNETFVGWSGTPEKLNLWLSLEQIKRLHELTGGVLGVKPGRNDGTVRG